LERRGIPHQVLNAKHHRREAEIVAQAGRLGGVTIATNMAGRGTDIILGGNPETMAWAILQDKYPTRLDVPQDEWNALVHEIEQREQMKAQGVKVREMGGLHIIGSERHEARRIDLQLRGRCGRQGDPGSSRFFLSLEDDLMRIFFGDWVKSVLQRLGMKEGEAIESRMVSRRIEGAQKKREESNFDVRKNLLEYDEVMDEQRKRVYSYRQAILDGVNCKSLILDMIERAVEENLSVFLDPHYGTESFAKWASGVAACEFDAKDFRNMEFTAAEMFAKNEAARTAESQVFDAIEENPPKDEDESEWNWGSLTKWANTRWGLNLRDRELREAGRDNASELLIERARGAIERLDMSDGQGYLAPDFGLKTACGWVLHKFGVVLPLDEVRNLDATAFKRLVRQKAEAAYLEREVRYPVMAGLYHFKERDASGHKRYDRESLVAWTRERFQVELNLDDLKEKDFEQVEQLLIDHSRTNHERANAVLAELQSRMENLFAADAPVNQPVRTLVAKDKLQAMADWAHEKFGSDYTVEELGAFERSQFVIKLPAALEDHFRPEIRRMERALVLQLLDTAWKDHLLAMDHLKSSVGLRGYAQIDPKVEYKREGMKTFELMWNNIGERVTDLFFRMEQLDEEFVGSTWKESAAIHEEAPGAGSEIQQQQQAAISNTEADKKLEPIRNMGPRVGRNDPCPCGSGKKYKQCCLRKEGGRV